MQSYFLLAHDRRGTSLAAVVGGVWTCCPLSDEVSSTECLGEAGSIGMDGNGPSGMEGKVEVEGVMVEGVMGGGGGGGDENCGLVLVEGKVCGIWAHKHFVCLLCHPHRMKRNSAAGKLGLSSAPAQTSPYPRCSSLVHGEDHPGSSASP